MKLYLISQTVNNAYDTYDSAVVAAENEQGAQEIQADGNVYCDKNIPYTWAKPEDVVVKYLGEAVSGMEKGVICASFNAG